MPEPSVSPAGELPPPTELRRRRRLRRIAFLLLLLVVGVPLLALLAGIAGLRSAAVRRAVLDRVAGYLAREKGLAFAARDFDVRWSGVGLIDVRVGAPGSRPLFTAERVTADVAYRTLRSEVLVIRSLVVVAPRLDLGAPFPDLPPEEGPAAAPGFEVRRLTLRRGVVLGAAPTGAAAQWVRSWDIADVEGHGSFVAGLWDLALDAARVRLDRPGFEPMALDLGGRARYRDGQPLEIGELRATGNGVRLAASGMVGLGSGQPTAVGFDADAEPRLLAAGAPPGGTVRARGEVRLPEAAGRLAVSAAGVPAEVLKAYLDPTLFADLSLPGSVADARADLALGPGDLAKASGRAEAAWRRGHRRLARVSAVVADGALPDGGGGSVEAARKPSAPAPTSRRPPPRSLAHARDDIGGAEGAVRVRIEGDLLPESPGRRHLSGTITAASWADLANATAERLDAELRVPDARATWVELQALWPRLVPELRAGWPVQGSLVADLELSGALTSPHARLDAAWVPEAGSRLGMRADAQLPDWSGSAQVEVEALPVALLEPLAAGALAAGAAAPAASSSAAPADPLPTSPAPGERWTGRLSGRIDLSGSLRAVRARGELAGTALAAPPWLAGAEGVSLSGDVAIVPRPLVVKGAVFLDGSGLAGRASDSQALAAARLHATVDGVLQAGGARPSFAGTFSLGASGLDATGTARARELRAEGRADFAGTLGSLAGRAQVEASGVELAAAGGAAIDALRLDAEASDHEMRLTSFTVTAGERTVAGSGRLLTEPLLAEANLDLRLTRPVDGVRAAAVTAALRAGTLIVAAPRIDSDAGPASLTATVPLGALRAIPQLTAAIDALPSPAAQGPVSLHLDAPALDSAPLVAALGLAPRPERVRAGVTADLVVNPGSPAAGRGEIRLDGLAVETPDVRAAVEGAVVVRLGEGRVELLPARVRFAGGAAEGTALELRGHADLDPGWRPEDPPAALVTRLALDAGGSVDAALLNPYLEGGAGSGAVALTAAVSGPPDALVADVRASGPGASFFWPAPYATRVQAPEAELSLRDGRWTFTRGNAVWNGGTLAVSGGGGPGGGAALAFDLSGVRYRLDYGLLAQLSGRLTLDVPTEPDGRPRLGGRLTVDRGLLERDVNLEREVRNVLLAPEDLPGTEETGLAGLDLDLAVDTVDGVRVRNNVGDLRAWWQRLAVTGTAEAPVVRGKIDLDPGGLLSVYGQTVRIDRGALVFTGDPLTDPRIELSTTSSLQDPTIVRLRGAASPLAALDQPKRYSWEEGPSREEALTAGLAGYYGERVLSRLGQTIGIERVSVRPVLVQEEDPSARLDLGKDLSRHASFALSVDLRNAERRTYLVDLHGFRELPGLALQGFVNDEGREGASLQQVLELGGGRPAAETGPRLRRLKLEGVGGLRRRLLRRAVPLARGQPVPASAAFDVEVVLAEALRRRGHPDPRITVAVTPVEGHHGRVDVVARIEPGPRAEIVFAGDRPPLAVRAEIAALYRTDFYEPASIEEMRAETVRAFRASGHLDARVEVEVQKHPDGARTVTLRGAAGPRAELRQLALEGLDAEAAAFAARGFAGTLARAELATAQPGADRRLLDALRALGYPQARIAGRTLERDGARLVVKLEPGERQVVAAVTVEGAESEAERRRFAALVPVAPGDPLRLDRVAEGALRLERALAAEGHPDATVRPSLHPGAAEASLAVAVQYTVSPGPRLALAAVDFEGEHSSRAARLDRIAGLEPGAPFTTAAVEEARARLFRSGEFTRVSADVERTADGRARVRFSLDERPRFHLGYGARWESGVGGAAVVDAVDSNFLGRGMTLGLRALYEPDDERGRLFLRTGAFTRAGISLEAYAQGRRRLPVENFIEDSLESALQLARPLGTRTTARLYARYRTTRLYEEEPDLFFPIDIEVAHPYLGTQLLYQGLDDGLDPTRGLLASLDLSGSGPWVGSDFDYARAFGQVQVYRRGVAAGRRFVWAQALRAGWARAYRGQELLRFERFFAGGEYSVRGYATESLGPQEVLGGLVRPLGGEALLVLNEELRVRLPWDLTGLVFLDSGQVWADMGNFGSGLATALGLGLRAPTPVGLLRLDAASPLDRRPGDESYRLYVGFGNAF